MEKGSNWPNLKIFKQNQITGRSNKAQSAIEYLMTYGWMLLVVAIVGGAVFSIASDQSIEVSSGFNELEINIENFGLSEDQLQLVVANPTPNNIDIDELRITQGGENISVPHDVSVISGQEIISSPFITQDDEVNELEVGIGYDTENLENMTSSGTITGPYRLEKDESILAYYSLNEEHRSSIPDLSEQKNDGEIRNTRFIETERTTSLEFNPECEFEDDSECDSSEESWDPARVVVDTDGETSQMTFSEEDSFTASSWIKVVDGETDRSHYYAGRGHTLHSYGLYYNPGSERIGARVRGANDEDGNAVRLDVSQDTEKNEFVHTVMTYSPEVGLSFYVDGELQGVDDEELEDLEDLESTSSWFLGGRARPGGTNADGPPGFGEVLDTTVVFNRSLAQEEVRELYETQK